MHAIVSLCNKSVCYNISLEDIILVFVLLFGDKNCFINW